MFRKATFICFASLFLQVAQQKLFAQLPIIGKSFFALTVKNADSVANWYTSLFNLKSIKEINDTAMGVVVKIIGNDNMVIEILQMKNSKPAKDWGLNDNFQMHGFVKVGFFVRNLETVQQHLAKQNIKIKYGPFNDQETKTKNLIISDCESNLIQFFEDIK
jgi:catechol-2,3-dioxygenase